MNTKQVQHTVQNALLAALLGGFGAVQVQAQYTFNSGSTGADGPLNVTTNTTLTLPPDGIFNFTTITIASNATLTFTTNTMNTPVYLLATGDVDINGTIDVSSTGIAGGPGGFAGGLGSRSLPGASVPAGSGYGPGAGRGGTGSYENSTGAASYGTRGYGCGVFSSRDGAVYGSSLLVPLVGGSGGGGGVDGRSGLGGGGAVLIAANTRINVSGLLRSSSPAFGDGDLRGNGYGSGGAIRLVAPVVAGAGTLDVTGGRDNANWLGRNGRIRIDCMDRRSLALNCTPGVTSLGANMVVFPPNLPRLDITQLGTNTIPLGINAPVYFFLPQDSPTNQTVEIQARDFGTSVPIRVTLTPEAGPVTTYDTNIDNTISPASVTLPVVVPVNIPVQVNAWTR